MAGSETYHIATLTEWQERLIATLNQENQEGSSSSSYTPVGTAAFDISSKVLLNFTYTLFVLLAVS